MARSIPTYKDPQNSKVPIVNAYGYTSGVSLDLSRGTGGAVMNIHRNDESAALRDVPVEQIKISFGQTLVPAVEADPPIEAVAEVKAATVQEFLQKPVDPTLKTAFDTTPCVGTAWAMILAALDLEWAKHPNLTGSTQAE